MSPLEQLTKKNQEFIHIATHQLLKDGKSDQEITAILEEILPTIIEHQKKGEPARHFLGAPTVWAAGFSQVKSQESKQEEKNTDMKLMWADMSLLLLGIICLINLAITLFDSSAVPTRFISLLTLSGLGGLALYYNYHFIYRFMGQDRAQRPPFWKSTLILVLSMTAWGLVSSLTTFLPESINFPLPLLALLLIGGLAFGARYFLNKKYKIQNALAPVGR